MEVINEKFACECGGPIRLLNADEVEHACRNRYAPATSFFDGVQRFIVYRRVQVNPKVCDGNLKFNWFVDWRQ